MSKALLPTVFKEGNIDTFSGLPGSGKSNIAVHFMDLLQQYGWVCHTIIGFFEYEDIQEAIDHDLLLEEKYLPTGAYKRKPENIKKETELSAILKGCLKRGKHVVFLDEAGIFGESTAPMSTKVKTLKKICFMIRHLNACIVLICQSVNSMSPMLRDELVTFELILKYDENDDDRYMIIKLKVPVRNDDDETGEEKAEFREVDTLHHLPPTELPYDNKFMARFVIDLDIDRAYEELGRFSSLDIIKNPDQIEEVIDRLIQEYASKNKKRGPGRPKSL